jgi:hypothetical protein
VMEFYFMDMLARSVMTKGADELCVLSFY